MNPIQTLQTVLYTDNNEHHRRPHKGASRLGIIYLCNTKPFPLFRDFPLILVPRVLVALTLKDSLAGMLVLMGSLQLEK